MPDKYKDVIRLLLLLTCLMMIGACAQKSATPEPTMATSEDQDALAAARAAEMARQQELEMQRLQEEAARREQMAARNLFLYEDVYFAFNRADLSSVAQDALNRKILWLLDNPGVQVVVEGHCDERGTNEFNMLLGEKRAGNVKTFLIGLGVDSERLLTISYGEELPVDPGHNEEAWAKNRRVHFKIR